MKKFAIIGVGGYIAPRHLESIYKLGHEVTVTCDINDSVGILDRYFPYCKFYKEPEIFFNNLDGVDYVVICTPNHLHVPHIIMAHEKGKKIICEKPLCSSKNDFEKLKKLENLDLSVILQLRYHDGIKEFSKSLDLEKDNKCTIQYHSHRGQWYNKSWKGEKQKSGGIENNIGIHFFDMAIQIFGKVLKVNVYEQTDRHSMGRIILEKGKVLWNLSIDKNNILNIDNNNSNVFREVTIGDNKLEFSNNFTELHLKSYEEILEGRGFGLKDVEPVTELLQTINKYYD